MQVLPLSQLAPGSRERRTHPRLRILGQLSNLLFVDLDAESRSGHEIDVPVRDLPHLRVHGVAREVLPADVVVDPQAHLLDGEVRADRVDLHVGGERYRPQRAVRRERDVVGLAR